jgi:hypothetical protein
MEARNSNIENEIREIAPFIANIGKENSYYVPEDYFNSLAASVLAHIRLVNLKEKGIPFFVQEDYFENLADSILARIRSITAQIEIREELSEIAPLLNTINKKNVFSIPGNYFEKLPSVVPEKKAGKTISLGSNIRKWVTYAAAASVLFIIATTSYLYVTIHHRSIEKHLPVEQKIAELNEQEIINYLEDNDGSTSGDLIPAANEDPHIQHMLQRVSDEEIENYLDDYGDQNEKPIKGI